MQLQLQMIPFTVCSMPEYSPSVFSLIVMMSTSSYGVLKPSIDLHGRTLANKLNCLWVKNKRMCWNYSNCVKLVLLVLDWDATYLRRARLRDWCPLPTGVASGPLSPMRVAPTDSITLLGMRILPSTPLTGVTSTGSHSIGALAASNIFCTLADISGPMPSPGISVTFFTFIYTHRANKQKPNNNKNCQIYHKHYWFAWVQTFERIGHVEVE